ncbi:hypothetical protein QYE76_033191 [Lolium multiflorum]|uniref:Uncharacterized protein n=1 Tax=Lolium multiflorum TaxID=4521 RepID=A0AAD8QV03_LOLMU|nr:hypothetical protein QYE76_033191 [Lolium multiflorum]
MGHGLHEYTRRHGGNKMPIEFTPGVRRPKDYVQSAKLSNDVGIHIREKMPLATHWTQYRKDATLKHVIPHAISTVAGKFNMDKNDEVAQDVCTDMLQLVLSEKSPSTTCNSSYQDWASQQVPEVLSQLHASRATTKAADQETNSIRAAETYHSEMRARLQEQDEKFEDIRKKQEEELEAVKKAQEENTLAYEKRLTEMDAVLNLLLRTSQPPSMSQSQGN